MATAKKDRQIVSGVEIHDGRELRTFTEESDCDELEALMTPAECKRLLEAGVIAGGWHAKGEPRKPMPGSREYRKTVSPEAAVEELKAELLEARTELASLRKSQEGAVQKGGAKVQELTAERDRLQAQLAQAQQELKEARLDLQNANKSPTAPKEDAARKHGK